MRQSQLSGTAPSPQTEQLNREKKAREEVGVSLYQVQQQLAKLQMNLEKVHENQSVIAQMREAAETDLTRARAAYSEKAKDVTEKRGKCAPSVDTSTVFFPRTTPSSSAFLRSKFKITRVAPYEQHSSWQVEPAGVYTRTLLHSSLALASRVARCDLSCLRLIYFARLCTHLSKVQAYE
eukprot:6185488-Pleurochrysis_carterae.AAC.1